MWHKLCDLWIIFEFSNKLDRKMHYLSSLSTWELVSFICSISFVTSSYDGGRSKPYSTSTSNDFSRFSSLGNRKNLLFAIISASWTVLSMMLQKWLRSWHIQGTNFMELKYKHTNLKSIGLYNAIKLNHKFSTIIPEYTIFFWWYKNGSGWYQ